MTDIKQAVREKYGEIARNVHTQACCGTSCDPVTADLYDDAERASLPETAVLASQGCGNPTALVTLNPGDIVLDLGSGGGIDVLLSAKRVGPTGKAYGIDMTDDMLALARRNAAEAGATNVEFLQGDLEAIPLPDNSVDVIISNCVINLAADKDRALSEANRVLRPGGKFAISDIVARGEVAQEARDAMERRIGCVAGALEENDYAAKLAAAGFDSIEIVPTRFHDANFMSAFVRARKPPIS